MPGRHDDDRGGDRRDDRVTALVGDVSRISGEVAELGRSVDVLARIVGRLARQAAAPDELVTRRLIVVDSRGATRMAAEVVGDTMELRLELPGARPGRRSAVVLHASPSPPAGPAGLPDEPAPTPLLGLQLWADGDAVAELDAWPDDGGHWRAHLHLVDDD